MDTTRINEASLDVIREALAPRLANHAAFDGWTVKAVDAAADEIGADRDIARLALDGNAMDLIDAWIESVDRAMAARFTPDELAAMKVRERITALVEARIDLMAPHREALRRAYAIMALPLNLSRTMQIAWRSVDGIWRLAGDSSTDYNYYTKRTTLSSVYSAILLVLIDDESEGQAETRAFLARRIDDFMRFEKAKKGFLGQFDTFPSLSRFVGRLRYPPR